MTTFVRGRTVETAEAVVLVDAGLAVGTHRFQLVVVSNDGRRSAPEVVDVVISRLVIVEPQPPVTRPPLTEPPVTRPPVTTQPPLTPGVTPVVTPVVRPVVTPVVTPVVRPIRAPAEARKTRVRKPAKPRSET